MLSDSIAALLENPFVLLTLASFAFAVLMGGGIWAMRQLLWTEEE